MLAHTSTRPPKHLVALDDGIGPQAIFDPDRWAAAHQRDLVARELKDLAASGNGTNSRRRR